MKILIKGGRVIDPGQGMDTKADVLIDNGKIVEIKGKISAKAQETINASGKIVAPGLIDMHTHLREPGREEVETIKTAARAAVKGAFTTISAMPNTDPPCDSRANALFLTEQAKKCALANVLPVGTITKGRKGKEIAEFFELKDAGVLSVSDDGDSIKEAEITRRAMEYASMVDMLVISHAEDASLSAGGVMNEGFTSSVLGLAGIPSEAENIVIERDIRLAKLADARIHIAHISTAEGVEIVRDAKKKGIKVTAEVTPHHLTLSDRDVKTFDTNLKVNPPLRTPEDIKALKVGLKDGTIDVIATDHAPHLENEKEKEFDYAPFGMIGLETALSLSVMGLISEGYLDWPELIQKMSSNPARILKYDRGTLKPGSPADVVIIDPEKKWTYSAKLGQSKASNSPFSGREMIAAANYVIVGGKVVVKNGQIT
ncbi:MAG: dihydroorotase [Candidatus Omnitrophica bacterium]|nr:dihydroorotase [Candidatus Omnitrophota bacterium]